MEKHLIYVTTGTCHFNFDRMLGLVKKCVNELDDSKYDLTLQYGSSNETTMNCAAEVSDFLSRERSEYLYKHAKFVFSHCGIGSIYNSLKYSTPTIIIPRLAKNNEFSDDHQLQIASEIKDNPLIFMLDEDNYHYIGDFIAFIERFENIDKCEIDLINYELANKMKSVLYKG